MTAENIECTSMIKNDYANEEEGTIKVPELRTQKCRLWTFSAIRLRIAVALALALSIEGLMRSNINMAMVCMINKTALVEMNNLNTYALNGKTSISKYIF